MTSSQTLSITQEIDRYLDSVKLARSANTWQTYRKALAFFQAVMNRNGLDPAHSPVSDFTEEAVIWFLAALKDYSPATEQLYLAAEIGRAHV
jgi:hypothetical protein